MNRDVITAQRVGRLIDGMAGESLHAKRVQSLTNAVVGVVNAVSASIHETGAGLAQTAGLEPKQAVKQVARRRPARRPVVKTCTTRRFRKS